MLIQCEKLDEISDLIVENEIAKASGTKVNILGDDDERKLTTHPVIKKEQTPKLQQPGGAPRRTISIGKTSTKESVSLKDEESVKSFIRAVRDDTDPTDWCLITYDAPKSNSLVALAKGSGGINEMLGHLNDAIVAYGLFRKSDKVDLSETVKFVFIDWRGKNINYMQRAQLGTHTGFVTQLFHPYHVDIQTSELSDLTEEIILDKIKHAAGTKNYVLN